MEDQNKIIVIFVIIAIVLAGWYAYHFKLSQPKTVSYPTATPLPSRTPIPTPKPSNPLGNIKTNPLGGVKTNPFNQ